MTNSAKLLLGLLTMLFFSSCSDIENEIWINKDGSGKYAIAYDMGPMLEMAAMFEGMSEDENSTIESEQEENSFDNINGVDDIFKSFADPSSIKDIDTTFNMYDVLPDSIRNSIDNPKSLKNIVMDLHADKVKSIANFSMTFSYGSEKEMGELIKTLASLDKDADAEKKEENIDKFKSFMAQYKVDLKKGILTLPEQDFSKQFSSDLLGEDPLGGKDLDNLSEEEMGMMQMMFGDASIKTTIHLPGKVISCDDKSAEFTDNKILLKDSFFDLMKEKKIKARTIKFKK